MGGVRGVKHVGLVEQGRDSTRLWLDPGNPKAKGPFSDLPPHPTLNYGPNSHARRQAKCLGTKIRFTEGVSWDKHQKCSLVTAQKYNDVTSRPSLNRHQQRSRKGVQEHQHHYLWLPPRVQTFFFPVFPNPSRYTRFPRYNFLLAI